MRFQSRQFGLAVIAIVVLFVTADYARSAPVSNYVQQENAKPGTANWQLDTPGGASGVIEGYASLTSVNRGGEILLYVNTAEPTYTIDIFRLGYYGGLGGRRMVDTITMPGTAQPMPEIDPATGLIECSWANPYVLDIPATADPTDWMSGIYVAKLTAGSTGTQQYIVFAVRDDQRPTDLLFAQTVTTYQAYNVWGGKSLYGTLANRTDTANKAMKVSFNRPYYGDDTSGVGNLFFWELPMLQWLESEGYDVSYATNIDVDQDPTLLLSHRGFLSVGHDEYWSWAMRDNVEHARDQGINLGFFSGNDSYWQVRFEASPITNDSARTLVGYKEYWYEDPITPDYLKTNEFRYDPVDRPEDAMIGVEYVTQARPPLVIEDASNWVFDGTGLQNGDQVTNEDGTAFLGYEVDEIGPESPPNLQRLAHSPATPARANFSDVTVYQASSGATVFATGSIGWSVTIPVMQQITRNVLARLITTPPPGGWPISTPIRPPLPALFQAADIGAVGRAGFVSAADAQSFTLNGAGLAGFNVTDANYFAYQPLTGDGAMTVRLTALENYWDNRAGIMIRDSLSPDAKFVAIAARPTGSIGALLEGADLVVRDQVGTNSQFRSGEDSPMPNWLALTRVGNAFAAYVSSDGVTWTVVGTAQVSMAADVYIGAYVVSARYGVWVTASFDNVAMGGPGIGVAAPGAPDSPSPAMLATQVPLTPTLSWTSAGATSDTLSFGTENPPPVLANGLTSTLFTLSPLPPATTYYWRITAQNTSGTTIGPVWTFTTTDGAPLIPPSWVDQDVGVVGPTGLSSVDASGAFTVSGAGSDVWGTDDSFHFLSQPIVGDGQIVARLVATEDTDPFAKAGVMFRDTVDPESASVILDVKPDGSIEFMTRQSFAAAAMFVAGGAMQLPVWLQLTRSGQTYNAAVSADGANWRPIGATAASIGVNARAGLAVTSHNPSELNTAQFDNVSIGGTDGIDTLPPPWSGADIGDTGATGGSSSTDGSAFVISGAGSDIWDIADGFHYVWQPLTGDGQIVARVSTEEYTEAFAKAGLMIRDGLDAAAPHVILDVRPDGEVEFMTRTDPGAQTTFLEGAVQPFPAWLALERSGEIVSAYVSSDGASWSLVGSVTVTMSETVNVGMVVTSHVYGTTNTSTFDNVTVP